MSQAKKAQMPNKRIESDEVWRAYCGVCWLWAVKKAGSEGCHLK